MIKQPLFTLLLIATILSNCSNDNSKDANTDGNLSENLDTTNINSADSLATSSNVFDMNPAFELTQVDENSDLDYANIIYYKSNINNQKIHLVLTRNKYNSDLFTGHLFNETKNKITSMDGKLMLNDTLKITTYDTKNMYFIGALDLQTKTYEGNWVNDSDTSHFKMEQITRTALQRELFTMVITNGNFYNTEYGIATYSDEYTDFNDFWIISREGNGYDYSEDETTSLQACFFYNNEMVFTDIETYNATGSTFEEGKEPIGPDDPDAIANGIFHDGKVTIAYSWLENGIWKDSTLQIIEEVNLETWVFDDKIIIAADNDGIWSVLYQYKWDVKSKNFIQ